MSKFVEFMTNYPKLNLLIIGGIMAVLAVFIPRFGLDASEETLIDRTDQTYAQTEIVNEKYAVARPLFIIFEPNLRLFSPQGIQLIQQFKDTLLSQPAVKQVNSILDVPLLGMGGINLNAGFPTLRSEGVSLSVAQQNLTSNSFYTDTLISRDSGKTVFQIVLNPEFPKHDAINQLRNVVDHFADNGQLYLGGFDVIADDIMSFIRHDLVVFGGGVLALMVTVLFVLFRRFIWVVLPVLSCVVSVMMMIGILGLMDWKVTVISSNFISLQIILTLSLMIHLVIRYIELQREFPNQTSLERVRQTLRDKIIPSVFACLTTGLGFASLVISDIYPIRTFGMMMMMGILVSLMVTLMLFGCILSSLNTTSAKQKLNFAWNRIHGYVIHAVQYYGGYIKYCALILVIGFGFGISLLTVENRFIDYFDADTPIHQSLLYIDQNFGGTTPMDIVITLASRKVNERSLSNQTETHDNSPQGDDFGDDFDFDDNETNFNPAPGMSGMMLTPQKVDLVKKAHQYLERQPEIGKVLSLATTFDLIETLYRRPLNVFELMVLPNVIPAEYKSILWTSYIGDTQADPSFDLGLQFRLSTRIYDSNPTLRRNEMIERIQTELPDVLNINSDQVLITGPMVLYNTMLQALFDSQIKSLGIVVICILLMLSILFRNIRLALVAVIPNLFSVIVVLGVMGWLKIPLDMMTTTIAAITIGIAIDNAIHYIYRFKREYFQFTGAEDERYSHALTATQNAIGTAMIYTTIVVSMGFGVLAFSAFIPNVLFGLLTALAMIISLFSSLILVPIFLKLFNPFRKKKFLFR